MLALIAAVYGKVLANMIEDWLSEPSLSYGLLVPPFAAWFAWAQRRAVQSVAVKPDIWGLPTIALACLIYLAGTLSAEFFLPRISFPLLIAGLIWTFWGVGRLKALAFPLVLLAAMVPLPELIYSSISLPLQLLASNIATDLARLCGAVVLREGNVLHLANISLGVEEACSGLNSLGALAVTALVFAFMLCSATPARIGLLLLWGPIAIGVNVLRVFITTVLADYDRQFALGVYHAFSGWLVYVLSFGLLYATLLLLNAAFERRCLTRSAGM
jgi:exosortase